MKINWKLIKKLSLFVIGFCIMNLCRLPQWYGKSTLDE